MPSPAQIDPIAVAVLDRMRRICSEYINAVVFLALDASRDPTYGENNLLVFAIEDHLEAAVGLPEFASYGLVNTCRRELRFLLEASIKLCYAQQSAPAAAIETKLATFRRELDSASIGIRKQVALLLLPPNERDVFAIDVGHLYGEASNYVHLTFAQVQERISVAEQGATPVTPSAPMLESLTDFLLRVLAASFVYVAHSVPDFSVGDLLVSNDGTSRNWELARERWIALIDEHFDYKAERQAHLPSIRSLRWQRVP
jgi:hypothetical protein